MYFMINQILLIIFVLKNISDSVECYFSPKKRKFKDFWCLWLVISLLYSLSSASVSNRLLLHIRLSLRKVIFCLLYLAGPTDSHRVCVKF